MIWFSILGSLPLGRLFIVIPKTAIIWLSNSSDPIGCPLKVTELLNYTAIPFHNPGFVILQDPYTLAYTLNNYLLSFELKMLYYKK